LAHRFFGRYRSSTANWLLNSLETAPHTCHVICILALLAVGSRQTVSLNEGWEYARVPTAPSLWNGPDAVPTATWKVSAVSSEETAAEAAAAIKAFDGRPDTFWHTEWSRNQPPFPHAITVDLGTATEAIGLRILPRQTGAQNGRPKRFRAFLDDKPVAEGTMPDSLGAFETRFPKAKGRRLRLEFQEGQRPDPILAIAEIGLIRENRLGTDWASQYTNATVNTGDRRYDLSPSDLERLRQVELRALSKWQSATLPHAASPRPLNDPRIWQGVTYYRRRLPAPPPGRRAELSLQGMQSMDLWLNGKHFAVRRGGYLPLRVAVPTGGELLVRVDNTDNPLIPPGKPQAQLDFMYGNGLIDDATLTFTDSLHITDRLEKGGGVQVDPIRLDQGMAKTWVHTNVQNESGQNRKIVVRQVVFDAQGLKVATKDIPVWIAPGQRETFAQSISVAKPQLWSPDSPALYRVRTTLEENGQVIDTVETCFGMRTIEVSRAKGFVLNGKPLRLVGTNRHQDYPWVGPALSAAAHRRDAWMIKRSGHNIVRLAHYNQSPAFLDACDEYGILTIPCIPGWQFTNQDPRFQERVLRDIRKTVRRDRHHPSVAFWEASLNETYAGGAVAKAWHEAAKSEGAELTAGDEGKEVPWDVTYNGWREDLSRPSNSPKPGYIREYGDFEFGGATSSTRVPIRQGNAKLLESAWNYAWSFNKFRPTYPATMGIGTWEMFDHNVPWDYAVSASGLADLMRREKPSFWFFTSQITLRPYLRAVPNGRTVVVFTNARKASLFVNGVRLQTASAVPGPEAPYDLSKAFGGTDTNNLPHPPIVFRNVPFTTGELKVVGANGATDTIRTPGRAARLRVWVDDLGVRPTANDLVFVRAAVVDAKGTILTNDSRRIRFEGTTFAGETLVPSEMGVASVLVRTPNRKRTHTIRARAGTLTGTCTFTNPDPGVK
jgi:beta-galactosidase